ncbi:nitroreductase family protein [Trichoderma pleuroticola]
MADKLISSFAARRSVYQLSAETDLSIGRLEEIIRNALLTVPSAFNTQSTRIVVLVGDHHQKLWDIVKAAVAPFVSGDQATNTNAKIKGFQGAYATILFFEDPSPYEPLGSFKMYADKFEGWREQASGMHQFLIWSALALEGVGGNLQHYNPIIDDDVKKTWSINSDWKLLAQLVIGKPVGNAPAEKEKKHVEDRYVIHS